MKLPVIPFPHLEGLDLKDRISLPGENWLLPEVSAGEPEIKNTNSDMKELDLKWEAEPSERSQTEIVGKLWESKVCMCVCVCVWLLGFRRCQDKIVVDAMRRVSTCMISRVHWVGLLTSSWLSWTSARNPFPSPRPFTSDACCSRAMLSHFCLVKCWDALWSILEILSGSFVPYPSYHTSLRRWWEANLKQWQ